MDNPPVTTTTPTVGAPALNNAQRVDQLASTFATMAAEARAAALGLRAENANTIGATVTGGGVITGQGTVE